MEQVRNNIQLAYTVNAAKRERQRLTSRRCRDRRILESKDELIFEYGRLASLFVEHGGDISIPRLPHTLKQLDPDKIYELLRCLENDHLRPRLYKLLEIELDTEREMLNTCSS